MAFKSPSTTAGDVGSPEELFRDLRNRRIQGLLSHQADILRDYQSTNIESSDVALQLPTGSGKTLVGLLLAEWRRRKFRQRVAYICPTKQLVHQVVEQSRAYGIKTLPFVGKQAAFSAASKGDYLNAETVAVTTYSALFNVNPFFDSAQTLVLDDAHAAENYVGKFWSLLVSKQHHTTLFATIAGALKTVLPSNEFMRLTGSSPDRDAGWVDKIATPTLRDLASSITAILDVGTKDTDLGFAWSVLRDHLLACHLYVSSDGFLLRPLIPPTWTHAPFANARQRVYMSATLGEGGDLERLWGRSQIKRLGVPLGWDKQGIGRRLFFFPERSLDEKNTNKLVSQMIRGVDRAMILVPDDRTEADFKKWVAKDTGYATFDASQLETSKEPFVKSKAAVAVVANRYDGVDLVGDECRLLIVSGLPQGRNLQERFLIAKVGAGLILKDRVLTRVTQAIGRCTRSATDYAAVVIMGQTLSKFAMQLENREFLHPEIQAEISFGLEQSKDVAGSTFLDNLKIFLEHGDEWDDADRWIVDARSKLMQKSLPEAAHLAASLPDEIKYQTAIWTGDYLGALEAARGVLGHLGGQALRGYRCYWYYLAGAAASLAGRDAVARDLYKRSADLTITVRWLRALADPQPQDVQREKDDTALAAVMEGLERQIERVGNVNSTRFEAEVKAIKDGLAKSAAKPFEQAQVRLGNLLGYEANRSEDDAAPDPWWCAGDEICIVFEDHTNVDSANANGPVGAQKVRQAASHPQWIRKNVPELANKAEIVPIMVSPCSSVSTGAEPHVDHVCYWNMDRFRDWADAALIVVRELWNKFPGPGDLAWRAEAMSAYRHAQLDPIGLVGRCKKSLLSSLPVVKAS
jgi:hypothetical protein